ncbi:phosphate transport system regulatory protein PhoU [Candidatus Velamenicoccus archaeovorus]|uniref:Phosphate-specific transport system accessory protein PhoU n=2 Tax=Velamenicoccus archaeovorus TaxID=1930593 RepID=A0A410P7T3_VELA1|nr:phosphate transport system regulatory protein PhoU [Candidatus Velamenicoccus archaeovorus]
MERHFDEELAELKQEILIMGTMVEQAVDRAQEALKNLDAEEAHQIILEDRRIDEMELTLDEKTLRLLALMQPLAVDLRFVAMVMKITTDLERMADLAVDIAQRVIELAGRPLLKPLHDIPRLSLLAQQMIRDALEAFLKEDTEQAKKVILKDSEADQLRNLVQTELIRDFMEKDVSCVSRALPLLLVARHLERICDHATNIAEDVIYMVSAKVVKHRPRTF